MRLGDLIQTLAALPGDAPLRWDHGGHVGYLRSYRGYYEQLALGTSDEMRTVAAVLADARAADGETFSGYKGGEYEMGRGTPIWAAEWGDTSDYGIAGARMEDGVAVLVRVNVGDYQGW
jgi:hypothetical protein